MKLKMPKEGIALPDKYRSAIIALLFLVFANCAFGQTYTYQKPTVDAKTEKRLNIDSVLLGPTICGTPFALNRIDSAKNKVALVFDSCNHRLWVYDPKLKAWDSLHLGVTSSSGGSGGGIISLGTTGNLCLIRINDSTYKVDTACLAALFLRRGDSALSYITPKSLADSMATVTNIYKANGTLISDRTVDGNTKFLQINNLADLFLEANNNAIIGGLGTGNLLYGPDWAIQNKLYLQNPTAGNGTKALRWNSVSKEVEFADTTIGGGANLGNSDLTQTDDERFYNGAGKILHFSNLESFNISTDSFPQFYFNTESGSEIARFHFDNSGNTGIGYQVFQDINVDSAEANNANGRSALRAIIAGQGNTANGSSAMSNFLRGNNNLAGGIGAMDVLENGNRNVGLGPYIFGSINSLEFNNNTGVGYRTGFNETRSNMTYYGTIPNLPADTDPTALQDTTETPIYINGNSLEGYWNQSLNIRDSAKIGMHRISADSDSGYVKDPITGKVSYAKINGGGSGEVNTASNLGGGLANYDSKSGVDLRFNSFAAADFDLASNVINIDAGLKTDWQTAYTDRLKWDGGATGLTASTGRTSLGGTTIGQNIFTSTNPSAITFLRGNADNSVDWLSASAFRTAIGAGDGTNIYIADGTLTANRTVSGNGNNLIFNGGSGSPYFNVEYNKIILTSLNSGIIIQGDSLLFDSEDGKYYIKNMPVGANSDSAFTLNRSTNKMEYSKINGSGGSSGTVNSGNQYRLAYYATTGTAVSEAAAITASRTLVSDANGVPTHATTTATEIGYVNGVTSAIQTQLNGKQPIITFGTGVETALGVNIGSAGAFITFNGAGGTPSSLTGTNITGTATGLTAGAVNNALSISAELISGGATTYNGSAAKSIGIQAGSVTNAMLANGAVANLSGTNTGDQNLFSSIPVAGQTTITANSATTALTLVAGTNMTITTNNTTKEITLAATGGGSGLTFAQVSALMVIKY